MITSPVAVMINRLNGLGSMGVVVVEVDVGTDVMVVVEAMGVVVLDEVVVESSPSKQALSPEMQSSKLSSKVTQSDVSKQSELPI